MTDASASSPSTLPFRIRIGTAGWSYADWEGTVYPPHGRKFDPLAYLASYFDTIEVNSSFYRIPPPTHSESWVRRISFRNDFRFTVKLFRGFTHDKEVMGESEVAAFRKFLDPLARQERLGALLIQFPWSFKHDEQAEDTLAKVFRAFDGYPRALEVRHASFQTPGFLRFIDEQNVSFVNIDQPLFSDSVRPAAEMTGPIAYARFHGRNYEKWFAHQESWERYNYLYEPAELAPWVERIRTMARQKEVYVITNNHFRGQAVVNALDLKGGLGLPVEVPAQLAATYPGRFPVLHPPKMSYVPGVDSE